MPAALRLSGLALAAALLALTVKKQTPELALTLSLCACAMGAGLVLSYARPLVELARELAERAGLEPELTSPLWRCLGMGLLTELASALCADAGEGGLAKIVELGGGLLCLVISLPLLQAVLALIRELL